MKNLSVLCLIMLSCSVISLTDHEILTQGGNGIFDQNGMKVDKSPFECLDDESAKNTVDIISLALEKGARGSISDIINMAQDVSDYLDTLPRDQVACLQSNKDIIALGEKYNITAQTDPDYVERKLVTYLTLHYLSVHKWFIDMNNFWTSGKYFETGAEFARDVHMMLGSSLEDEIPLLTDKEILQQLVNGLFEQNKLPDSTKIVPCFDDSSAHATVEVIGTVLDKAAKGSPSDIKDLKDILQKYSDNLPKSVKDCLAGDSELVDLAAKYGINNTTDPNEIEKKIISYVTLHYLTVHKWLGGLDKDWKAGKPYDVGFAIAGYGHQVLQSSDQTELPGISDSEILQQGMNGLFEQNKLPDPKNAVKCFDDKSAHITVQFIGTLLDKAAKGSISDLVGLKDLIEKFGQQLPQSVKDCLNNDKELQTLGPKYGITNKTDPNVIEKKIISYVTLHYLTVHKWLGGLDSNWKAAKYYQVGYDAASYGHTVLSMTPPRKANIQDIEENLASRVEKLTEKAEENFERAKDIFGKLNAEFMKRE